VVVVREKIESKGGEGIEREEKEYVGRIDRERLVSRSTDHEIKPAAVDWREQQRIKREQEEGEGSRRRGRVRRWIGHRRCVSHSTDSVNDVHLVPSTHLLRLGEKEPRSSNSIEYP
jgi:hypothetical protein